MKAYDDLQYLVYMVIDHIIASPWKKYTRIRFNKHYELVYSGHSKKLGLWIPKFFEKDSRVFVDSEIVVELLKLQEENKFHPSMIERWLFERT